MKNNKQRPKLKPKQWLFVDTGLDDFRGGAPNGDKIKLGENRPEPKYVQIAQPPLLNNDERVQENVDERANYLGLTKKPQNLSVKLSKKQAVFSKQLPQTEQRKELIQTAENHLLAHPLALYPHLLKAVPVDLVENVSHLLESDLHFDADDIASNSKPHPKSPTKATDDSFQLSAKVEKNVEGGEGPSQAVKQYRWLIRDEDKNKPSKSMREMQEEANSKRLDGVTDEFARWANELSESTPNVDPNTIKSLFASGYETKPALTVPIQVYELSSLPAELRINEADAMESEEPLETNGQGKSGIADDDECEHERKYGAWYINPQSWNNHYLAPKQDPNKMLLERATDAESLAQEQAKINTSDPNLAAIEKVRLKREFMEQAEKKKHRHVDEQEAEFGLAGLHSARAFRDYLETQPDLKKPAFMRKIYQIQDETVRPNSKA